MGVTGQPLDSTGQPQYLQHTEEMLLFILLFCPLPGFTKEATVSVQDAFAEAGIVKDLKISPPEKQLQVLYPGLNPLAPGETLSVTNTVETPGLRLVGAVEGKLYTVAMVDPDAPSRKNPRAAQWLHWIITNVKGELLISGEELVGDQVTPYAGPSPPKSSGPHRYVLLVWQQQNTVSMESPRSRARGDISRISKSLGLGAPIAGNYFFA